MPAVIDRLSGSEDPTVSIRLNKARCVFLLDTARIRWELERTAAPFDDAIFVGQANYVERAGGYRMRRDDIPHQVATRNQSHLATDAAIASRLGITSSYVGRVRIEWCQSGILPPRRNAAIGSPYTR